ncbi:hypothetical protein CPB83DRAFT_863660 [Crepidotus variabilis]|uniref:Uncharacterized protein n=1 Tax=Crepidotus variabilis TaxID=179855 RepID=A0A9P6E5V5_9AGAR|nr:hypothetical protein CPB83DRAFT_863660 [Crepidotus variabilis]
MVCLEKLFIMTDTYQQRTLPDATMMMQSQSMTIYRNIYYDSWILSWAWPYANVRIYPWDIPWLDHFSRASASLMVTSYLVCLNYDGPTFKNVGPLRFCWATFSPDS